MLFPPHHESKIGPRLKFFDWKVLFRWKAFDWTFGAQSQAGYFGETWIWKPWSVNFKSIFGFDGLLESHAKKNMFSYQKAQLNQQAVGRELDERIASCSSVGTWASTSKNTKILLLFAGTHQWTSWSSKTRCLKNGIKAVKMYLVNWIHVSIGFRINKSFHSTRISPPICVSSSYGRLNLKLPRYQ